MSYGHTLQDFLLAGQPRVVPAGSDRVVVTAPIAVSVELATNFAMYIEASDFTVVEGETITAILQQRVGPGDSDFEDVGCVAAVELDVDGRYCIFLSVGVELEAFVLPLTNIVRLAIETGPGSSCTITSVRVWIKP